MRKPTPTTPPSNASLRWARPLNRGVRGLAAVLGLIGPFAGCLEAEGPEGGADESVAESGGTLTSGNGLRENGLRENGLRENGLRENGLRENGFATASFKAWFDKDRALADNVMTYVAKCALGQGQTLSYTDGSGKKYGWPGSLGLAPGWATRAATVAEQEWVSACLMAFTNKCGNNVTISLRAPSEGAPETERFPVEAGEREGWTYQEAAFFGNLFTSTTDMNACDGKGSSAQVQMGLGRECGSDSKNCGYKAHGACSTVCTISQNADGYYKSCTANGRAYARVITTYLDPTTWRGSMDCRNKRLDDDRLSAGGSHACARSSSGHAYCWGANYSGQLGDGTMTDRYSPTPVAGLSKAVQLTAGLEGSCARSESGSVYCWGRNGPLGTGLAPALIAGVSGAVQTSGGWYHTCARTQDGSVYCWGSNFFGERGLPTGEQPTAPNKVAGISNAVEVSLGQFHSCARLADNTVRCWGYNNASQLGNGATQSSSTPVVVSGLSDAVQLSAGGYHTCARLASGTVRCWGSNIFGQLGDGTIGFGSPPTSAPTLSGSVAKITAGDWHTCALKTDGTALCWGRNDEGQGGSGDTIDRAAPAPVVDLNGLDDITAGRSFTCARKSGGGIWCWGMNDYGQLGIGTSDYQSHPVPTKVTALPLTNRRKARPRRGRWHRAPAVRRRRARWSRARGARAARSGGRSST